MVSIYTCCDKTFVVADRSSVRQYRLLIFHIQPNHLQNAYNTIHLSPLNTISQSDLFVYFLRNEICGHPADAQFTQNSNNAFNDVTII